MIAETAIPSLEPLNDPHLVSTPIAFRMEVTTTHMQTGITVPYDLSLPNFG